MIKICNLIIFLQLISLVVFSQSLEKAKEIQKPGLFEDRYGERLQSVTSIDFTGDGKEDYLLTIYESMLKYAWEHWYDSKMNLRFSRKFYFVPISHRWFVNLDHDPYKELITASGYEDGIDYSVYKISSDTLELLFRFNPLLIDNSRGDEDYFWGYPWTIDDIVLNDDRDNPRLYVSFTHRIDRSEAMIDIPEWQSILPVLFFRGTTSQENATATTYTAPPEWATLDSILIKIK